MAVHRANELRKRKSSIRSLNEKSSVNFRHLRNKEKKKNINWEIPRKTLHSSIGFLVIYLYQRNSDPLYIRDVLLVSFFFVTAVDIVRFNNVGFNRLYIKFCGFLMRDVERHERWNGVIYYLAGCFGALSIFPKDIAALSIIILSWCDTAASYTGRLYGHYTYRFKSGKSVAGTLGAITAGTIAGFVFWPMISSTTPSAEFTPSWQPSHSILSLPVLALVTGIIGGVSELIDVWGLDDNLVMPLAAGTFLFATLKGAEAAMGLIGARQ